MIYRDIIKGKWEIRLSNHARRQAKERKIYSEMIISTIMSGEMKYFGKNYVKFVRKYERGNLICIGERKEQNKILILTIEWG
jgi:beta-lactamase regulating signal transducer with metallopeptidase domain